jgi:hypothetical protein
MSQKKAQRQAGFAGVTAVIQAGTIAVTIKSPFMRPETGCVLASSARSLSSEPWEGPVDRFQRRQRVSNQGSVFFDVIQPITNSEGRRVPSLMIDPVCNFLARGGKSGLPGVKQGEEGGDGLFFGHGKHLR